MNKWLLSIITILIPITIISFYKKETNFIMEQKQLEVKVIYNNEIINIPLEEYVIGVVAGEMPASFEEEALKAQAVAARTFYINKLEENNDYKINSTIKDQVYITQKEMQEKWREDYNYYYNKIKNAVYETKNQVIKYNGYPIKSFYYAKSNGYTESCLNVFNQDIEYLKIKETKWDKNNEDKKIISLSEFKEKLNIVDKEIVINNITKDESNRVSNITINNKIYSGIEIRKLLNLKSTDFDIKIDEVVEIKTNGYGHGVGMSQYGANELAKNKYNYKEIISFYYEGTYIEEI